MVSIKVLAVLGTLSFVSNAALAKDVIHKMPIELAMKTPDAKAKLGKDIKYFFKGQKHPAIAKDLGEFVSNRKTNALNKDDITACNWVFLSVMISFRDRVKKMGGDAVVDLRSYYKKNELKQGTTFECATGTVIAGAALKGRVVKFKK